MESLLVFALCTLAVAASAQLPSGDILALLEFKKGVKHDPTGYILDSWNEESIDFNGCPSSWNGIVCNGGNVAGVVLDNLGLVIDADLGSFSSLPMLLKLSMANNSISGVLSSNIGRFASLKYFDISNNLFSGGIPEEIGRMRSLQNFSVGGNNFSGPLPHSVGDLTSIQSLDFSRNSLSGALPSTLTKLKSLVYLNLSFNLFSGRILTGFEEISPLEVLDLSSNSLEGGIDWTFLMQTNAVHVDLSGNFLISLNTKELSFLSDVSSTLKLLNLSRNRLTGSLINGGGVLTFGSLKVLDLSHNQLSGDLPGFDYAYDLEILRLAHNFFTGFVPSALLKGDSLVLSELDLSFNNLSGHIRMITSTTLQILNLSSNSLSGDLPLLTGSCTILDLSRNGLTGDLSALTKWEDNIQFIDLSVNRLAGPFPELTSEFLRLNHLNLSHNLLVNALPTSLSEYPKLSVLDLSYNQFSGPMLVNLLTSSTLQELYLENNFLEGEVNLLETQSSERKSVLRVLNLSSNRLNGSLPNDLATFSALQELVISNNNFSGLLPSSISKLVSLSILDISQNQFHGPFPPSLPSTLIYLNVSFNDLSGSVPAALARFPVSSFHPGNSNLKLPSGSGSSSGASGIPSQGSAHKSLKRFIKVVIIVSCVAAALMLLIFLIIVIHYKRALTQAKTEASTSQFKDGERVRTLVLSAHDLPPSPRKASTSSEIIRSSEKAAAATTISASKNGQFSWSPDSGMPPTRIEVSSPDLLAGDLFFLDENITLTPEELSRAPAEVLGRSSHGTSYKATLESGILLTVKWLRDGVARPKKEFAREAKKFANIRHPNVVVLRGYYWGATHHEKLILSDFISPGSLASFLYDRPGRRFPALSWAQRLKIAVDVARGLNYLHFDRAIPHGNLKATNVLLDGLELNARVADYCLHRLMNQAGTMEQVLDAAALGYRAPELAAVKKPIPSFKSDVYAFGVILVEIFTGKCAGDVEEEDGADVVDWLQQLVADGRRKECFDVALAVEMASPAVAKAAEEVLDIALRCLRPSSERPGIKSVYEDLSSI